MARVPSPDEPLPPLSSLAYYESPGRDVPLIRANETYLRQDFSVTQPVEDSGPWPGFQRYDYLVTEQPIADRRPSPPKGKARKEGPIPQRERLVDRH